MHDMDRREQLIKKEKTNEWICIKGLRERCESLLRLSPESLVCFLVAVVLPAGVWHGPQQHLLLATNEGLFICLSFLVSHSLWWRLDLPGPVWCVGLRWCVALSYQLPSAMIDACRLLWTTLVNMLLVWCHSPSTVHVTNSWCGSFWKLASCWLLVIPLASWFLFAVLIASLIQ